MKTDIEIAQGAKIRPIVEIAEKLGIPQDELELYGKYKAKIPLSLIDDELVKNAKLILVTAITPTPAGEGKTTTSIGLAQALNRIGKKTTVVLREPSLGPVFGIKGGAAGGGYSQVIPMEDINLHFTGDMSAVEKANNLLAALIDNNIQLNEGNLGIDPRTINWKRVMDMNERSLRDIIIGLGGPSQGVPRESGFNITAASEVMATLCIAKDLMDLKERLGDIFIGYTYKGKPVFARDLKAQGAMTALLKEAIKPNLVQTLEGTPAIIHGGPFANIAQGTNTIIATKMGIDDPSYPPPPRPSRNSFNINPERPDHPVFYGITRAELRIWSDYTRWDETQKGFPAIYPVTNGFILKNKPDIDKTAILANYSVGLEGIALAEIFHGKGSVLLSGFDLSNRTAIDPIADRLLSNMVQYMSGKYPHEKYIYIDSPILWGEYETEKGLLTGIYSGMMLNSKPALFGSYENLPLILLRDGHLFGEKGGGWNNAAGKEYVPYGRRMFGPYFHRDFGGVPFPLDTATRIGEGTFWCQVPDGTSEMETLVWNPAEEDLPISIKINVEELISTTVGPGEYKVLQTPVKSNQTNLKVSLRGDRRLVILQTSFN